MHCRALRPCLLLTYYLAAATYYAQWSYTDDQMHRPQYEPDYCMYATVTMRLLLLVVPSVLSL